MFKIIYIFLYFQSALSYEQVCVLLYEIRGILKEDNLVKEADSLIENINDLPKQSAELVKKTESYKTKDNALTEAIKANDLFSVKCLVYEGGDINKRNSDGNNALHIAAIAKQLGIYVWLGHRNGSEITATNNKGETSMDIAIKNKMCDKDSIEWMIKNVVSDMDSEGNTILHNAAQNATLETVNCILKHGMEKAITKNKDDYNALHYAAIGGNDEIMKVLLENYGNNSVNIRNKEGETPMHLAAIGGHLECAKLLVNKGADFLKIPNYEGYTALQEAVHRANSVADFLIDEAPKRNLTVNYVDLSSTSSSNTDIDIQDLDGNTALHSAAQNGTLSLVKKLVEVAKADVFVKNNKGENPIDLAKLNTAHPDVYEWLSERVGE
jgi:ankyrin repeat protein